MTHKYLNRRFLPIIIFIIILLLTIPLLIWGVSQRQELRNKAAGEDIFPYTDLNNDGVINNVDLRIYLEKYSSPSPKDSPLNP
ncbi:MAG: hypothetical protein V1858_04970 [Candidatus Gottesmanbacteria bacterium]